MAVEIVEQNNGWKLMKATPPLGGPIQDAPRWVIHSPDLTVQQDHPSYAEAKEEFDRLRKA
jgi:hypothetical protein